MAKVMPDILTIGPAVRLVKENYAAEVFRIEKNEMADFLAKLLVPYMEINGERYYMLYSIEHQLFERLKPAAKSFSYKHPYPVLPREFEDEFREAVKVYGAAAYDELHRRLVEAGKELYSQIRADREKKKEAQMQTKRTPVVRFNRSGRAR